MNTIIIKAASKKHLPFLKRLLKSLKEVESVKVIEPPKNALEKSIFEGFVEVNEIISGKRKPKKTMEEFMAELSADED